eukprot:5705924-Prymnesium_polylepis.2
MFQKGTPQPTSAAPAARAAPSTESKWPRCQWKNQYDACTLRLRGGVATNQCCHAHVRGRSGLAYAASGRLLSSRAPPGTTAIERGCVLRMRASRRGRNGAAHRHRPIWLPGAPSAPVRSARTLAVQCGAPL